MIVNRDYKRFSKMYPESRPVIPEDYSAPLDTTPIRVLIRKAQNERISVFRGLSG